MNKLSHLCVLLSFAWSITGLSVHINMETPCFATPEIDLEGRTKKRCLHDRNIPWQQYQIISFVRPENFDTKTHLESLNSLSKYLSDITTTRAVLSSGSSSKISNFANSNLKNRGYRFVLDKDFEVSRAFNIKSFPTTIILNRFDRVCYVKTGVLLEADRKEIIQKVMQRDESEEMPSDTNF